MTNAMVRLDRVRARLRPATCSSAGPVCEQVRLIGDGTEDPPVPRLPATCRRCGRPISWEVVVLAGVDVDLL